MIRMSGFIARHPILTTTAATLTLGFTLTYPIFTLTTLTVIGAALTLGWLAERHDHHHSTAAAERQATLARAHYEHTMLINGHDHIGTYGRYRPHC